MLSIKIPAIIVTEIIEANLSEHHSVYAKITEANNNAYGKPVTVDCNDDEVQELLEESRDKSKHDEWIDGFPWRSYLALLKQLNKKLKVMED